MHSNINTNTLHFHNNLKQIIIKVYLTTYYHNYKNDYLRPNLVNIIKKLNDRCNFSFKASRCNQYIGMNGVMLRKC